MNAANRAPFDPNFEGLLREAAADPRSMLLRVKRPQVFPALRSREAAASVAMAGLSSVERELLASYRSELGLLLRQAAVSVFLADKHARTWIDGTYGEDKKHEVLDDATWASRAKDAVALAPQHTSLDTTFAEGIAAGLVSRGLRSASLLELAAACLRVESVDQPRIYAGAFLAATGGTQHSLAVLKNVLDGNCSAENEAFARQDAALALGREGRLAEAALVVEAGVSPECPRMEIPMCFLFYTALQGNPGRINRAADTLDALVPVGSAAIEHFCAELRSRVREGLWDVQSAIVGIESVSNLRTEGTASKILQDMLYAK
jgi:hypothetical protein